MKKEQQMAECFNIEELEERLEFADWSADASIESGGGGVSAKAEVQASW